MMLTAASNTLGRFWRNAVSYVHKVKSAVYGVWAKVALAKHQRMALSA
jgi:hypothetical protein